MTKNRFLAALSAIALTAMLATSALAVDPNKTPKAKTQTINGHLVDVACANDNALAPKAGFATKHSKHCLQMPECEESGYAVLTDDNKIIKFDKDSNETAKKFITTAPEKDVKVSVTGTINADNTIKVEKLAAQ